MSRRLGAHIFSLAESCLRPRFSSMARKKPEARYTELFPEQGVLSCRDRTKGFYLAVIEQGVLSCLIRVSRRGMSRLYGYTSHCYNDPR
jgi:hypothetical protein